MNIEQEAISALEKLSVLQREIDDYAEENDMHDRDEDDPCIPCMCAFCQTFTPIIQQTQMALDAALRSVPVDKGQQLSDEEIEWAAHEAFPVEMFQPNEDGRYDFPAVPPLDVNGDLRQAWIDGARYRDNFPLSAGIGEQGKGFGDAAKSGPGASGLPSVGSRDDARNQALQPPIAGAIVNVLTSGEEWHRAVYLLDGRYLLIEYGTILPYDNVDGWMPLTEPSKATKP